MHLCRGNRGGQWHAEGSYDDVAERLFNALEIPFYFLEYDSPRAGGFEPIKFIPREKAVVLGLITTKMPQLEERDFLRRRIEAAAKHFPLEQLCVSTQCGFASVVVGNPVSIDEEEKKLRLVVEAATDTWGEA